jgi:hypothetical protein
VPGWTSTVAPAGAAASAAPIDWWQPGAVAETASVGPFTAFPFVLSS